MEIEKLIYKEKQNCTGCIACVNSCPKKCISIKTDREGFWYPLINHEICIQCGNCDYSCPMLSDLDNFKNECNDIYAAINKDNNIRQSSSSGGMFQLLAENILDSGGIVFGAMFNDKWEVVHGYAENIDQLCRFRGSKYVQSYIGETYQLAEKNLKLGRKVLFSGTPCQIVGLKRYLRKEYEKLITVDLVCHGVPSPLVWQKYITFCSNGRKIYNIIFRNKKISWERYLIEFDFENSSTYQMPFDKDLYLKGFLSNLYLRPSCYSCRFKGVDRESDITLADFWGIDEILPDMNDHKGTSLVLLHTKKGDKIFSEIQNKIRVKKMNLYLNKIIEYNSSIIESAIYNPKKEKFFKELNNGKLSVNILIDKYTKTNINKRIYQNMRRKAASIKILKKIYRKILK
ncbi:Coenzyme F420 hydrogenase/dehydrogenase, beta subunit C-terminal domain [Megasphaera cerevisiae]|uniref:Coenzyme F420 hydrogenase/dehydrogenase, beta subunit C-terminal domain n=1 Tax=Megasphaera cerevisiae TaxID=39029 RepID=UPI0009437746|nr:Coenzyme F420 hydrogenase/dehydrogenase, beta subunit C-terminal domain [Megasphaera cerevisiae]OKY52775.1 hypothetical protein BSR42_11120 [Megasphaera cerevisiae]